MYLLTIAIFLVTYLVIISEKVHRTVVALAGAALMIMLGVLNQEQAIHGVDFNTLGLLIGMMVIVGIARQSGVFQYVAIAASKMGKGKPIPIFILLGIVTAVFSALLDNVTTVVLMVPVMFIVANHLNLDAKPYLIGTILLSNIGGAATLIGDPPNILIGSAANLSFNDFLIHLGPISLVTTVVTMGLLYLVYKKTLCCTAKQSEKIMQFNPKDALTDIPLLKKSLFVFGLLLVGFLTHSATGIEAATLALGGAALLLLLTMNDPDEHIKEVEWTMLFFFIGLFILVTGLEHVGVIEQLAESLLMATGGDIKVMTMAVLWGSGILSALVDNIPFVTAMIPLIQDIGTHTNFDLTPLWWALALGADFGGNATLVGASSNVVVSGMAEKAGQKIGFTDYMKVAVPLTAVALFIATGYIWVRYLM